MKIKVSNDNVFDVGIRFENEANREILIRKNSFALMDEDDILYVDTVSTLFEEGILYFENQDLMERMGYTQKNPNTISEEEIKKVFSLSNTKMKDALEKIDAQHAIDKIIKIAKESDLSQSKLKLIKDRFGVEIFEDIDQTII